MNGNTKVAISADFLSAFAALPRQIQGKVTEFINKFRNNPTSPGINYEKLTACKDKKICSVRIDNTYLVRKHIDRNISYLFTLTSSDRCVYAQKLSYFVGAVVIGFTLKLIKHYTTYVIKNVTILFNLVCTI